MLPEIDLRLRPDANSPAEARRSLEALRPALDDVLMDDAALLVSEVVSNSVRHASLDDTDAIEVRIRGSHSKLRVDVSDPGPGFDPERVRPVEQDGGWGLHLLDRLATRWGVERGRDEGLVRAHVSGFRRPLTGYVKSNRSGGAPWARRPTRPRAM